MILGAYISLLPPIQDIVWMDPSNGQHQNMATHSLGDVMGCPKPQQEKKVRPQPEQALKCPRCDSTNTKFCYYNNYSLSQPRYFCKACRRYWTKGGSLRNVPVGGGCRKNKRSSSSKKPQDQALTTNPTPLPTLPSLPYDSNDLTLAFARLHNQRTRQLGLDDHDPTILGIPNTIHCDVLGNHNTTPTPTTASVLDAMRSGFLDAPSASALHNNYFYGFGNGSIGEVESLCGGEEVVFPYEEMGGSGASATTTMATTTTTKQEFCKSGDLDQNKVFWGMPWQLGGEGNMVNDTGRDYWNGIGSSWHGLVNGPLV